MSKDRAEIIQDRFEDNTIEDKSVKVQVYYPAEIRVILGISKSRVYTFLAEIYKQKNPPFRVIKIGKLFRIPKVSFDEWLAKSA